MEGVDETEKLEITSEEKKEDLNEPSKNEASRVSKTPRKKMLTERIVTAALGVALFSGGCSVAKGPNEVKNTEPIEISHIEEVLEEESVEKDLFTEVEVFEQKLYSPQGFEFMFPNELREYIDSVQSVEGEILTYSVFEVRNGQNHLDAVEKFAYAMANREVESEYNEKNMITTWELDNGAISYKRIGHYLEFDFEIPLTFPNIHIDPESKTSIEQGLKEMSSEFFRENLDYRVDEIIKEGDYYIVRYSHLLNNIPIYEQGYPIFLTFSKDGGIKEGQICLKDYEKIGEVTLLPSDEVIENIGEKKYPKTVRISSFFDEPDNFDDHYFQGIYDYAGKEKGIANLQKGELVYYYRSGIGPFPLLPTWYFEGEGEVEIAENVKSGATFEIIANALSFEHVASYARGNK